MIDLNSNPDFTYEWSPTVGLDDPTSPTPMADPSETTIYSVIITDITGTSPCSIVREVEVFVPETIELIVPDDFDTDCGDEATLIAESPNNDNLDFVWTLNGQVLSNEAILELDNLSGLGEFVLTATDVNGCQQTASVNVTGTQLDVDIDNLQFLCEGEDGQLSVLSSNDPNDILNINWIGQILFLVEIQPLRRLVQKILLRQFM